MHANRWHGRHRMPRGLRDLRDPQGWGGVCALVAILLLAGCGQGVRAQSGISVTPPAATYEVVNRYPHDPAAFTQGLLFDGGVLYEGTGLNGESGVRRVELETGRVLERSEISPEYFGEGLTLLDGRLYQLTWQSQRGFVYGRDCLCQQGEFTYEGEGWGLATDGQSLILSDGTPRIRFLDPKTFAVTRSIEVTYNGLRVLQLNELEYIHGEIYANIWQTDYIVRIDPATGNVTGWINLGGLLPLTDRRPGTDVLNGIAYDPATDRLFVTGKKWPALFEIRLKPPA